MKVQENIGLITWSVADKCLFIIYGIVSLIQMRYAEPSELGLYALLMNLHTWILVVTDSFALQNIIQFGAREEDRPKVNTLGIVLQFIIIFIVCLTLFILQQPLSVFFKEPRLVEVAAFLPVIALLFIPRSLCIKFMYRDHQMKKLFFSNLAFFGTMTVITVVLISKYHNLSFENLFFIYVSGTLIGSLYIIIISRDKLRFAFKGPFQLKKIIKFSLPLTLTSGFNFVPKQLDVFLIQYFFSTSVVGVYYAAKNLFRVFEEALNAANGLVYPASVRFISKDDKQSLHELMTKSVSFLLFTFFITVVILEAGAGSFIIKLFLPIKYHFAIEQFNLLLVGACFIPFFILPSIINASGRPILILGFVIVAVIMSFITFVIVGISGNENLIPLGSIVYTASLGIMCFIYVNRKYDFKTREIFRAFKDSINYLKKYLKTKH